MQERADVLEIVASLPRRHRNFYAFESAINSEKLHLKFPLKCTILTFERGERERDPPTLSAPSVICEM